MVAPIDRELLREYCTSVPLFPLPGVVFLPHSLLPLHVFEPRYRALVEDVVAGNGILAVPRLSPGWEHNYEGTPTLNAICGVGQIVRYQSLPDGRSNMIVQGVARLRLTKDVVSERGYRVGRGELMELDPINEGKTNRIAASLKLLVAQLIAAVPETKPALGDLEHENIEISEWMDRLAHFVLRKPDERQLYLEYSDIEDRSDLLMASMVEMGQDGGKWGQ